MLEESRRQQIERANKMLFDEADKVKAFHRRLLMSDVMKEREAQIAYKAKVAVLQRAQDRAFCEEQARAIEVGPVSQYVLYLVRTALKWFMQ